MNWKSYYRAELEQPAARAKIEAWLSAAPVAVGGVAARGILSFPHTALGYAGPLQARVARALAETPGVERVLALGVLHGSVLAPYRRALDRSGSPAQRAEAFAAVRGGFLSQRPNADTPFGPVPTWRPGPAEVVREDDALLRAEFSLDTFCAVLRVAADALGRRPLPVCPVYVGMTRDPVDGSFAVAEALGNWLGDAVDAGTALVATGDLVHYGTGYGAPWLGEDIVATDALERALAPWVDRTLEAAFVARDWAAAYALSRDKLGNDQREMLAALSSYLGPATPAVLAFGLSDYSTILGERPPCVVASTLAAYSRCDAIAVR